MLRKLLDRTECQLLLDTGAKKSFMSKSFLYANVSHYILYQNLLQKTQRIQVGNGQFVSVFFVIPVIIDVHGHRF